jgi:hypothetical protein
MIEVADVLEGRHGTPYYLDAVIVGSAVATGCKAKSLPLLRTVGHGGQECLRIILLWGQQENWQVMPGLLEPGPNFDLFVNENAPTIAR